MMRCPVQAWLLVLGSWFEPGIAGITLSFHLLERRGVRHVRVKAAPKISKDGLRPEAHDDRIALHRFRSVPDGHGVAASELARRPLDDQLIGSRTGHHRIRADTVRVDAGTFGIFGLTVLEIGAIDTPPKFERCGT